MLVVHLQGNKRLHFTPSWPFPIQVWIESTWAGPPLYPAEPSAFGWRISFESYHHYSAQLRFSQRLQRARNTQGACPVIIY